jgi:hypothetical protein
LQVSDRRVRESQIDAGLVDGNTVLRIPDLKVEFNSRHLISL